MLVRVQCSFAGQTRRRGGVGGGGQAGGRVTGTVPSILDTRLDSLRGIICHMARVNACLAGPLSTLGRQRGGFTRRGRGGTGNIPDDTPRLLQNGVEGPYGSIAFSSGSKTLFAGLETVVEGYSAGEVFLPERLDPA